MSRRAAGGWRQPKKKNGSKRLLYWLCLMMKKVMCQESSQSQKYLHVSTHVPKARAAAYATDLAMYAALRPNSLDKDVKVELARLSMRENKDRQCHWLR
jgi:hypothetical protein